MGSCATLSFLVREGTRKPDLSDSEGIKQTGGLLYRAWESPYVDDGRRYACWYSSIIFREDLPLGESPEIQTHLGGMWTEFAYVWRGSVLQSGTF